MFFTLGGTQWGDKEYTQDDIKAIHPLKDYGLDDSWYGGRAKAIAETESDILLILEQGDGWHVLDTAVTELEKAPRFALLELARRRKLEPTTRMKKEELLELLGA